MSVGVRSKLGWLEAVAALSSASDERVSQKMNKRAVSKDIQS